MDYDFPYIGNFMSLTDEVIIFQRGRSATKQNQFHLNGGRMGVICFETGDETGSQLCI